MIERSTVFNRDATLKEQRQDALDTMCDRCFIHDVCMGSGCSPRKILQKMIDETSDRQAIGGEHDSKTN